MSRIGKLPIKLPQGVSAEVKADNTIVVKGPLGELSESVNPDIELTIEDSVLTVSRPSDEKHHRAAHGFFSHNYFLLLFLKGKPKFFKRAKPSSSVFAVVTKVISIPIIEWILSISISGKIICSLIPSV